jgi:flagellar biosynthesis protein FlhG
LIFDQNKEKFQPTASSGQPQENPEPLSEMSAAGPEKQDKPPTVTYLPKPDPASLRPVEPVKSPPDPFSVKTAQSTKTAPTVSPKTPVERAKSEASPVDPDGQEKALSTDLPSKPDPTPVQPVEQAKPVPEPPSVETAKPSEKAPSVSVGTDDEQTQSWLVDKPSTESLMNVIAPAKKSQAKPQASEVKKSNKKIIAVGGAKGGVGKSMLAANLAVGLALLGQKVVLADLDLGGADVHLYTGVKTLVKTWNDFLDKKVDSIQDILTPTAFQGLSLIGGDSSRLGSANLPYSQKLKIVRHLKELETDFLVVDLGGDTTYNGLDFFLLADQKIVVSGTEPASVLDSYTFVKVVFNRLLERFFSEHKSLKKLAEQIRNGSLEKSENYSLEFIYQQVRMRDPQALVKLKKLFDEFSLSIVLNMTEGSQDLRIAETMQKLVKDKCFLDIGILGTIPFDKVVRKAARGFTPIVVESPKCQASRNIHQMLAAIILHTEQETTRTELLQTTNRIRREAKEQIDAGNMTLDGLTIRQINSVFNTTPRLRQSFQKILSIISG